MTKAFELAPDIFAKSLAHYLFDEFGTIRGKDDIDTLNCTDVVDLYRVIQMFLNR